MKVLRMERLAPAVLLVLFDGVPAVVHIEEPRQGIQFGVRLDPDDPPAQPPRQGQGARQQHRRRRCRRRTTFTPDELGGRALPPGAPGVINIAALRKRLAAKAPNSGGTLEPNEYALQMLRFPVPPGVRRPRQPGRAASSTTLDTFKVDHRAVGLEDHRD